MPHRNSGLAQDVRHRQFQQLRTGQVGHAAQQGRRLFQREYPAELQDPQQRPPLKLERSF